jgi:ligand-binding sensor domain-containing protein
MVKSISERYFNVFVIGVLFLLLHPVKAQQILRFDRLNRIDGLSQSSVNCMLKDREGFMWFGTQDGLNLYDGRKFRVFQNQPGDETSLSNNYILSLCEDEEGNIWVGTMAGGLNRFDKRTETFKVFQHSEDSNSISENSVWAVLSDGRGIIWAGTSEGLNQYNKKSDQFTTFRPDSLNSGSIATEMVVSLYKDHWGRIWVGTVDGLCMWNDSTGEFEKFYNNFEQRLPGANIIWSISETSEGDLITGTNDGVYLLELSIKRFTRIMGAPGETKMAAWSVNTQQPGIIWSGTDRGLFHVDLSGRKSTGYLHDPNDINSIADDNVWCLLYDTCGFLWTGTNNGICKTRTIADNFRLLSGKPNQSIVLSSSKVTAVLEDRNGNVWVGTDGGGLNCIRPVTCQNLIYNDSNSDLRNDYVYALAEDKEGNIYIGNYQGGLHKYDPRTGKFQAFPMNTGEPNSLANKRVLALLVDKDGIVWIGTRGSGLNRFDPVTGTFEVFQHSEDDPSGFPANTVLSVAQDSSGRIWAGTQEGGLALYHPENKTFKTFKHMPGDKTSLSDNNVWALKIDQKGRLWAGTQGGLNVAENPGENLHFRYFTTREGLKNNFILALQEDTEGNIWMSSFSGLAKLDIKIYESAKAVKAIEGGLPFLNPLFTLYDMDHGLQDLEFNHGCSYKGNSGTLYFGGNHGLNYFSAKDVQPSSYAPPVLFTGMKVFNEYVGIYPHTSLVSDTIGELQRNEDVYSLPVKITYLRELTLSYRESVVSFEFVSLDYANPRKNRYAYKLINFDENWNDMGDQNTATYTNLSPGRYTLEIMGSNSDGIWNPEVTALKITIVPPFWKTTWFIALSVIFIILAICLALRMAYLIQRRKARKEKEFIELQLKTIKSQIDPHFAFNAINTIASFIYSDDPDTTYDYFTRFAMMIRNILEDNEKISRPLKDEIEFVHNYLELQKMRFKDKFDYFINIDPAILPETQVPNMMIQSYAENAIKHGLMHRKTGGILKIDVNRTGSCLTATIEDNGIGRAKAAQLSPDSTRKGFKIMEQIIELYRKLYHLEITQSVEDLVDEKGEPLGTKVILSISQSGHGPRTFRKWFGMIFNRYGNDHHKI